VANIAHRTREMTGVAPDAIPYAELLAAQRPVILKGVARDLAQQTQSIGGPG